MMQTLAAGENGQRLKDARTMASEGSSANSSSEAAGRSTRKRPHVRRADSSAAAAPAASAAVAARTANNAVCSTGGRLGTALEPEAGLSGSSTEDIFPEDYALPLNRRDAGVGSRASLRRLSSTGNQTFLTMDLAAPKPPPGPSSGASGAALEAGSRVLRLTAVRPTSANADSQSLLVFSILCVSFRDRQN